MSPRKSPSKRRTLLSGTTVVLAVLTAGCSGIPPRDTNPWCSPYYHDPYCIQQPTVPTVPTVPRPPTTTTTTARDTTAPNAPQNLAATSGDSHIRLDWSPAGDASGYRVYRKVGDGAFELVGGSFATTYSDTGVSRGKKYSYYVTAYDGAGNESGPSNTVTARAS